MNRENRKKIRIYTHTPPARPQINNCLIAFHGGLRKPTALHGARTGRHEISTEHLNHAILSARPCSAKTVTITVEKARGECDGRYESRKSYSERGDFRLRVHRGDHLKSLSGRAAGG